MSKSEETLHLVAGRAAMAAVSKLLGLKLTALCSLGGQNVRLGLRHGGLDLVFYILPQDAPEAELRTPGLALGCDGDAGPAQKRFLQVMAAKLGKRTFQDVLRLIARDPETFSEPETFGPYGVTLSAPLAAGPIGLQGGGWRNFFADQDFEVLLGYPELSMNKTLYARYSDRECLYSWAGNDPRKWSFFAYPIRAPSESFGATVFRKGIVMELGEHDMILGSNTKADAMVESVAGEAARSRGDFVVFNQFCTTTVLGEDSAGVTDRLGKASGRTAVSWSHSDRDRLDNFGGFFKNLFDRPGFFDAPADPDAVNLFHFPPDFREAELVPLLGELGLKANLRLFPDVDFSTVERLPRGSAQVFCEASSYQAKLKELLAGRPRPIVEARAPFGLKGTRECLRAIAAATGRARELDKVWKQKLAALEPDWEKMKAEAAGRRLAFVVSETTLPRLWQVRHGQGAPLMRMILEMGFGVDLLYYAPHAETPELPEAAPGAAFTTFRTPRELELALRGGAFHAVYSDIFFDWRISSAGKARFSSKDFEMGLAGALRSFERLLALCRLPFYARYGGHLPRPAGRSHV
ncbi:MAG: hypothetical protein HY926_12400 [Elusimicrobia bacterium]|nr:hypothetical protein [Elusimicrobiota bacterium]